MLLLAKLSLRRNYSNFVTSFLSKGQVDLCLLNYHSLGFILGSILLLCALTQNKSKNGRFSIKCANHSTTCLTPMPYHNNKQRSSFLSFVLEFLPTTKILSDVILEGNWSPFYFLSSMFVNNLSEGPTKPNKQDGDDFGARNLSPKRTTSPI